MTLALFFLLYVKRFGMVWASISVNDCSKVSSAVSESDAYLPLGSFVFLSTALCVLSVSFSPILPNFPENWLCHSQSCTVCMLCVAVLKVFSVCSPVPNAHLYQLVVSKMCSWNSCMTNTGSTFLWLSEVANTWGERSFWIHLKLMYFWRGGGKSFRKPLEIGKLAWPFNKEIFNIFANYIKKTVGYIVQDQSCHYVTWGSIQHSTITKWVLFNAA